jgi:hypothetical protein
LLPQWFASYTIPTDDNFPNETSNANTAIGNCTGLLAHPVASGELGDFPDSGYENTSAYYERIADIKADAVHSITGDWYLIDGRVGSDQSPYFEPAIFKLPKSQQESCSTDFTFAGPLQIAHWLLLDVAP